MNKPVAIPAILALILLWLLFGCSGPQKDQASPLDNQISADESLKMEMNAFYHYKKAEPLWNSGNYGSDSVSFYYGKLLEEDLTPDQQIYVINRLAYCKYFRSDFKEAYDQYRRALPLIPRIQPQNKRQAGITLYNLGDYHYLKNQSDSALFYLLKALDIFNDIKTGNQNFKFLSLYKIANQFHWGFEDYANAERYYILARENLGAIVNRIIRDSFYFNIKYSMSSMYRVKKEYDKAIVYAEGAMIFADSLKKWGWMEYSQNLLSNIYRETNDFDLARKRNIQATEINEKQGGRRSDRAVHLVNLSQIFLDNKEYDQADLYYQMAFRKLNELYVEAIGRVDLPGRLSNHTDFIYASGNIADTVKFEQIMEYRAACHELSGRISQETGKQEHARKEYREALRLRKIIYGNFHKRISMNCYLLGKYFQSINHLDSSLYYFQESLISGSNGFTNKDLQTIPTLQQIAANVELIEVLRAKALVLQEMHAKDPASRAALSGSMDCLGLCDSLIDFAWNSLANEDSRLYLEDKVHSIYDQAIETAYQLFQQDPTSASPADIFHFMEGSRYRFLSDNLTSLQAYTQARIPYMLVQKLREEDYFIKYYNRQKNEVPEKSANYNKKLYDKIREKDMLMDSIDQAYPEVATIKSYLRLVTLNSVKEKIRNSGSILVQYFSGNKHFFILSTDGRKTSIRRVEKNPDLLGSLDAMLRMPDAVTVSRPDYIRFAVNSLNLYERFLKPTLDEFNCTGITKLTIIPDGNLNRISFDAFITAMPDTSYLDYQGLDYLVKRFDISYAFSSGILVSDNSLAKSLGKKQVLGLSYGSSDSNSNSFVSLQGANRELGAIKKLYRGRYLKDQKATESCFKKYAPDYQIIHLALHGSSGIGSTDSTMLIFHRGKGDPDDGLLLPEELYSLNLKAKLVVLSSCESGIGKNFRGEGVYSMARAFAYTGCPTLVTTLWKIPDSYTFQLMAGFYGGLKQNLTPDQALRKSKADYLVQAGPIGSHPSFWASFIPIGEMKW